MRAIVVRALAQHLSNPSTLFFDIYYIYNLILILHSPEYH